MKKILLVLSAVLALSTSAFAKDAALFGAWLSPQQAVGGGLTIQVQLAFAPTGLTATSICRQGATVVTASAHGDFETANGMITTSGNDSQSNSANGVECNASIQPASIAYSVSGAILQLTQDGQTLVLNKTN
jgi:hypothetical protein